VVYNEENRPLRTHLRDDDDDDDDDDHCVGDNNDDGISIFLIREEMLV
jgi:hypothetical protein